MVFPDQHVDKQVSEDDKQCSHVRAPASSNPSNTRWNKEWRCQSERDTRKNYDSSNPGRIIREALNSVDCRDRYNGSRSPDEVALMTQPEPSPR